MGVPDKTLSYYVFTATADTCAELCSLLARAIPEDAVYVVEEDEDIDGGPVKVCCWLSKGEMDFVKKHLPCLDFSAQNWDVEYDKLLNDER